jgi:hypothetical protein
VIHCAFHNPRRASGGSCAVAPISRTIRRQIDVIAKNFVLMFGYLCAPKTK